MLTWSFSLLTVCAAVFTVLSAGALRSLGSDRPLAALLADAQRARGVGVQDVVGDALALQAALVERGDEPAAERVDEVAEPGAAAPSGEVAAPREVAADDDVAV